MIATRKALAEFDRGLANRDAMWEKALTNEDVAACQEADKAALKAVRQAFFEDTKEINSISSCMIADLDFMRQCAGSP